MMLNEIVKKMDKDFFETPIKEDLVSWAFTDESKNFAYDKFVDGETGLMIKGNDLVSEVFTCVFITDEIIDKVISRKNCLIVTHHNFNYYEDQRGLCPIAGFQLEKMKNNGISLYVAHAGLDTSFEYGTSKALADILNIEVEDYFFDYFGKPTGVIGNIKDNSFDRLIDNAKVSFERLEVAVENHNNTVKRIAVIAGGGDEPEILQQAFDLGADTLVGGTIDNKWGVPFVQENNKKFRELNKKLKLNLIGGSHYATERPAMIRMVNYFTNLGILCSYIEDEELLNTY